MPQTPSCKSPTDLHVYSTYSGDHLLHQCAVPHGERAFTKFGVKPGNRVSFRFDGQHHTGVVNRITKRATVLVEDASGEPYSNGKRYRKFYVPIGMLEPVNE